MIDWLRRKPEDLAVDLGTTKLPLAIRRHPRARRLTMRLAPDGSEIHITMPQWGRTADALAFAESRREWLAGQLAKLPARQCPLERGNLHYRGETLRIAWQEAAPRRPLVDGGALTVGGPRTGLSARLRRWLENEAQALMEEDLAFYCERAGREPPPLRLSRAQRRWGSCSSSGAIRVNWRLVQAPDFVRRSVVAHEVAHLVHFDHSHAFHALLEQLFEGDLPAADCWLKEHGRNLYAAFG